ncbi:MAG: TlpA disulfide reductase family protein [Pseudomonadota bacterium]|uniref:TlpA family protein disulfide reductase n=1 Tax=Sphingobium sp. TaxID=1912891 RepID=UPI002E1A4FEF
MKFWAISALAAVALATTPARAAQKPVVGSAAPDFDLLLVDGGKVSLADLKGQVVVLNFWATWCVPCRTELPTLDAYYAMQQKHGLKVYAITTEDSVPLARLKKLFAAMAMPSVRRIKGPYGPLTGVPTNFVIDRAGVLRYAKSGAFDLDALNRLLVPLLREKAPE